MVEVDGLQSSYGRGGWIVIHLWWGWVGCNSFMVGVGGIVGVGGLQSSYGRGGWVAIQLW